MPSRVFRGTSGWSGPALLGGPAPGAGAGQGTPFGAEDQEADERVHGVGEGREEEAGGGKP